MEVQVENRDSAEVKDHVSTEAKDRACAVEARRTLVLNYLRDHPNSRPVEIARHVHSIDPSMEPNRKSVNPMLYELLRNKKITKTAKENGGDPRWSLVE